jgi:hypothetical protein
LNASPQEIPEFLNGRGIERLVPQSLIPRFEFLDAHWKEVRNAQRPGAEIDRGRLVARLKGTLRVFDCESNIASRRHLSFHSCFEKRTAGEAA